MSKNVRLRKRSVLVQAKGDKPIGKDGTKGPESNNKTTDKTATKGVTNGKPR